MKVGYARVSSVGQNLESQLVALKEYGCEKIFQEKASGTSTKGREQLTQCLEFVRESDEFVVTRIDRCSRSVLDLQLIVKQLDEKGVSLAATEQSINTKRSMLCSLQIVFLRLVLNQLQTYQQYFRL